MSVPGSEAALSSGLPQLASQLQLMVYGGFMPQPVEKLMSDDLNNRGSQDRSRINVNEQHEIRYWTQTLGVTEQRLRDAVAAVGVSAEKVRAHLNK